MNQQFIEFDAAANDLLACATYLAQKIKSSDGHAEAVKEIVPYYLEKDDVDLAAQLADSVEDTFVRDRLLTDIAEKCAELDDDEYAGQLAEAIEDVGLSSIATERIAIQKASKNEFEKAFQFIEPLNHKSDALAGIGVRQFLAGNETEALKTVSQIEDAVSKVNAFQEFAEACLQKGEIEKSISYLEKAYSEAKEIEFIEEKIRTLVLISAHFTAAGRKDRAIEILAEARSIAETLEGFNRENFLASISIGFLRAGSLDLADRTLDLVSNKTLMASVLNGFASEFDKNGEREEALETLDEAHSILKSEPEREVRDSRSRFGILSAIAVNFAKLGDSERGVDVALENPYETERFNALKQIAQIDAEQGKDDLALQSINAIGESAEKIFGLIGISDAKKKSADKDAALNLLNEAYTHCETIRQHFLRSNVFNWLTVKFYDCDDGEKARNIAFENLQTIPQILDESHRVIALAHLAKIYDNLEFELNEKEKEIINIMLRKSEW